MLAQQLNQLGLLLLHRVGRELQNRGNLLVAQSFLKTQFEDAVQLVRQLVDGQIEAVERFLAFDREDVDFVD